MNNHLNHLSSNRVAILNEHWGLNHEFPERVSTHLYTSRDFYSVGCVYGGRLHLVPMEMEEQSREYNICPWQKGQTNRDTKNLQTRKSITKVTPGVRITTSWQITRTRVLPTLPGMSLVLYTIYSKEVHTHHNNRDSSYNCLVDKYK